MVSYYPEEFNISKIVKSYPELEMVDEDEVERFADVADRRRRGKGAPKKAKTKGLGRGDPCGPFFFSLVVQFVLIAFFYKQLIVGGRIRSDESLWAQFEGGQTSFMLTTNENELILRNHSFNWHIQYQKAQ